jgi:hypothetical protein
MLARSLTPMSVVEFGSSITAEPTIPVPAASAGRQQDARLERQFRVVEHHRPAIRTGLLKTLHPDHHHAGADSIAFGRLAPRGTGLHVFNHSGKQVDGIGLRGRMGEERAAHRRELERRRETPERLAELLGEFDAGVCEARRANGFPEPVA